MLWKDNKWRPLNVRGLSEAQRFGTERARLTFLMVVNGLADGA